MLFEKKKSKQRSIKGKCSDNSGTAITQSCPTLRDPTDCSPPGSSAHGTLQARILEWVAMPSTRGSSQPTDPTLLFCTAGRFFTVWATWKPKLMYRYLLKHVLVVVVGHAKSCPTLCNPMECSVPGLPVLYYLPEFAQTHVHWVGDAI